MNLQTEIQPVAASLTTESLNQEAVARLIDTAWAKASKVRKSDFDWRRAKPIPSRPSAHRSP
jgi:hypothetical protein